jgi:hypothetical protein
VEIREGKVRFTLKASKNHSQDSEISDKHFGSIHESIIE